MRVERQVHLRQIGAFPGQRVLKLQSFDGELFHGRGPQGHVKIELQALRHVLFQADVLKLDVAAQPVDPGAGGEMVGVHVFQSESAATHFDFLRPGLLHPAGGFQAAHSNPPPGFHRR